jgi:hypothetical protein
MLLVRKPLPKLAVIEEASSCVFGLRIQKPGIEELIRRSDIFEGEPTSDFTRERGQAGKHK